jgi:hypothetical protein
MSGRKGMNENRSVCFNMKYLIRSLVVLFIGFCAAVSRAESEPRGTMLELHSCELYAGGCIVSSEATLEGRYMLRAWSFSDGSFNGTLLKGLNLAVLQSSADNLAAPKTDPGSAVVYLPANASPAQREALMAWLKASAKDLGRTSRLEIRNVPITFSRTTSGYTFSAGTFLSVTTAPLETCTTGACGEALWYTPRTGTSVFTVAVDRSSKVDEPLLQLKWSEAGRRSVFLGRFGGDNPTQNSYVNLSELCRSDTQLF